MGAKKGTYKIRKVLLTYMMCILLILSIMPQVVQAEEEYSEDMEGVQAQEEVLENLKSISITSEEESEAEESTSVSLEETSEDEKGAPITSEEPSTEKEELIQPEELDLGDYLVEMTVGDKQLLVVTILPMNASEFELSYHSSNTEVATVNGMGRITALKKGKTKIT